LSNQMKKEIGSTGNYKLNEKCKHN